MANARRLTIEILGDAKGARKAVKDTDDALGHLSATGRVAAGGLRVVGTGLKGLAVAATATAVVGVGALIGFGKSVVTVGTQYQDSLNSMQAVTHATDAEMLKVAKTSRDLGNDLTLPATSAADAANAMVELAKGNLTADQAMSAAKGTLQLAAAAQIDGAQAATIQADALNAFGLQAGNAGHVADVLANAANAATGEISDFALGMQASSAVAHTYGISLDNTVTALALFANAGIKGSDAGTSLKTALVAMAHPSAQAAAAFKTLGVHAFDAKGNFVGLSAVSGQLADAQKRMSKQAFIAAAATAFGTDAVRAAAVFADAGAGGFDKMAAAIGRQGGAAEVAKARTKGLGGAIAGFQSQIETLKIDIFTREAPHLESFIRLLSDKLPGAAEAGLRGLDRLTALAEKTLPAVRAEAQKLGPAVQQWVSGKLELAGRAAETVAVPALRGLGNILVGLTSKAQDVGRALDTGLRAGIDAAAKVAAGFETDSHSLGQAMGAFADSTGHAAHDALPALKLGLAGASGAAGVLVTSVTGAASILAPFAGYALLAAGAIKGIALASAGLSATSGLVGRVTTSYGRMADRAAITAGIVTQKLGQAVGKDLNTAATAGSTAMTGTRAAFTALGGAAVVAGVAVLAIGYAHQKDAQAAAANTAAVKTLFDATRQGGQAGQDAQRTIDGLSSGLGRLATQSGVSGEVGKKLASEFDAGKDASDRQFRSLSSLDQASVNAQRSQSDLALALHNFGPDSDQATEAAQRYQGALAQQKLLQDQVNTATQTGADKLSALVDQVDALAGAQIQGKLADLQARQGLQAVADAQVAYGTAVQQFGRKSAEARAAQQGLTGAQLSAEESARSAAGAARAYALANDHSKDAATHARVGALAYRGELQRLATQLAPGSPVRKYLQGLITDLGSIPANKSITFHFNTDTSNYRPPNVGPRVASARAAGGLVRAGLPYIVGEKRPELFVPDQNGTIVPRIPSTGGGTAVAGPSRVVLEIRSGGSRVDDALVELIRKAVRDRGGNVQSALGPRG